MASRSQVLAPKRRTGWGSRSAGTQTMCMSECTSMPATWGCWTESATGCSRGEQEADRDPDRDALGLDREGLRWLMMLAPFERGGEESRHRPRGERERCNLPSGINATVGKVASHQCQSRRLSGQAK